ncbi:hypothetical protein DXU77_16725 [Pseudomonas lactis]|nr:hypothetical protein [Pseudomonas lactis]
MPATAQTAFAGKPAPTGDLRRALILWAIHNPCGSWLACESGGSAIDSLTDTPPSRASPLPQETVPDADFVGHA